MGTSQKTIIMNKFKIKKFTVESFAFFNFGGTKIMDQSGRALKRNVDNFCNPKKGFAWAEILHV